MSGALDGVLVIYRTFESAEMTGRFDEKLVAALPASVKFICHNGTQRGFPSTSYASLAMIEDDDSPWCL